MRKEIVTDINKLVKGDRLELVSNVITGVLSNKIKNKRGELVDNFYIYIGKNNNSITLRNRLGQLQSIPVTYIEKGYLEKVYKWTDWRSVPNDSNALFKTNRKRIWYKKGEYKVKADCNIKNGDVFNLAEGIKVCQEKYQKIIDEESRTIWYKGEEPLGNNVPGIIVETKGNVLNAPPYCRIVFCMNRDYKVRNFMTRFLNEKYDFENNIQDYSKATYCTYKGNNDKTVFIGFSNLLCLVTSEPHERPTYNNLYESLYEMFWYCFSNRIRFIAMPKICCGRNKLEWDKVKQTIRDSYEEAYNEYEKYNNKNPFGIYAIVYDNML